jgi:hypothetical protein
MSVRQKQKGPKKKREEDRGPRLSRQEAKIRQKVNPSLRKDLDSLRRYEKRILTGLKDDETARLFLSDPGAALAKIGVTVPPAIRKRLKPDETVTDVLKPRKFRLPNGQIITPRIRINFTGAGR